MAFLDRHFLLQSDTARWLFERHAEPQPIVDYHCHLSARDLADNRRFDNLTDLWIAEDHYKWRAMRAHGIPERLITGDADPYDRFMAWASTVPACLRNPLYHWTHLELQRHFGIDDLLDETTARSVWDRANEQIRVGTCDVHRLVEQFRVRTICTTDDPADELTAHADAATSALATRVYPTFRPDRALDVHEPDLFNPWIDRLGRAANVDIVGFRDLLDALRARHQAFHDAGGRLSDHGLPHCYADDCDEATAATTFDRARGRQAVTPDEHAAYASYLMLFFGQLDAEKGWTKQLHLGARRNVSTRARAIHGRDSGHDSIGDWAHVARLGHFLDRLDREHALPKMIVYNVNPADNYAIATMLGNFQEGRSAGAMQFGTGWWYLDQKDGIERQIDTLSNTGLLAHFVGMTTDSRSFLSFPRHEYFRRILCNVIGRDVENGELPDREDLLGSLVEHVAFKNADRYFGLA